MGIEHEAYQKKAEELQLEKTTEYKTMTEESRDRMRAIIQQAAQKDPEKEKKD